MEQTPPEVSAYRTGTLIALLALHPNPRCAATCWDSVTTKRALMQRKHQIWSRLWRRTCCATLPRQGTMSPPPSPSAPSSAAARACQTTTVDESSINLESKQSMTAMES